MPTVSIVLATYNGARHLPRQLESLAWQTRLPDELVACDDRSTDDTVAILRDFAARAPFPVRITVNERQLNYRRNFVQGVGLATGDLVMFCDQDDIWRPDKVAVMAQAFADDPALLLAFHDATVVDADERPVAPIADGARQAALLAADPPPPWHFARGLLQAFRRDLSHFDDLLPLTREHFDDNELGHDRWYFLLALAQRRVRYVDRDLLMYRQHGANAFGADKRGGGWCERLADRLVHHAASDAYGAASARSRADVLERAATRLDDGARAPVLRLAAEYRRFAARLDRRHRTYTAAPLPARGAALTRSLAHGDYRGNPWGFDPRSLVRDLWTGVVRGGGGG